MVYRFNILYFVAAVAFFVFAIRGIYLRKNLEELEKRGTIKPQIAAHIRNMRRPWFPVWMSFLAGAFFLVSSFVRI